MTRSLRITTQKEKEKQLHSTCPILPGQWDSAPRRFFPVTKLPSQRRASAQPAFQAFQVPQQRPAWVPPHPRDQQSRGVWRPPGARKKGRTAHSRLGRKQWRPFPYPLWESSQLAAFATEGTSAIIAAKDRLQVWRSWPHRFSRSQESLPALCPARTRRWAPHQHCGCAGPGPRGCSHHCGRWGCPLRLCAARPLNSWHAPSQVCVCPHAWEDSAPTKVVPQATASQLLEGPPWALSPISGLHHWAHLQLAPPAVHLPAATWVLLSAFPAMRVPVLRPPSHWRVVPWQPGPPQLLVYLALYPAAATTQAPTGSPHSWVCAHHQPRPAIKWDLSLKQQAGSTYTNQ